MSTHLTASVAAFQSTYAHLCDLSARSLCDGAPREDVLRAFEGRGDGYPEIRHARRQVDRRIALVKHIAARHSVGDRTVARELVKAGRLVRAAAEAEWMVEIPIVNPNP